MNERRVTSQDVATAAGVSQSAVSRVFTPGASVSAATVAKVRAVADRLGYRPNVLARGLVSGRSRLIGVVVAYLENQFYPDAVERLSRALQAEGYRIIIFTVMGRGEGVGEVIEALLDYQVDGIIAASVGLSDTLTRRCADAGIPVVLFNRGQIDQRLSQVTSANRQGGQDVADFLVGGGRKRIAHVSGWLGSSTGFDRAEGFADGLSKAGLPLMKQIDGKYQRDVAAAAALEIVEEVRPDAIFVGNDHMAFAVLDALRGTGVSVPDDIAIVGYDDVTMASWPSFDLTTVRQPSGRMVASTVEMLIRQIDDHAQPAKKVEIAGEIVVRGSAPAGGGDGARV
ncbi:MAG: LacI family DNA-binding transcriptional regulator [Pseudomonadota bacterium]